MEIPVRFDFVTGLVCAPDGKALLVSGSRSLPGLEISGLAFYSAGDPLLHGETFRFRVP